MADVLVVGGVFREVLIGPQGRAVRLAGSGLYAALAAARAGAQVELVAPIGDEDRSTADALCAGAGVHAHWLSVGAESATFVVDGAWWRPPRPQYKPAGEPQRLTSQPEAAGVVLMFGHPEWDTCVDAGVMALIGGAELLWDRQGWLSRCSAPPPAAATGARARVLLGNSSELAAIRDGEPTAVDVRQPPEPFAAWVIKDGPWGVHLRERHQPLISVGAVRVRPRASIGSGDVFAGALAATRARGGSLLDGCRAGVLAAAEALSSADPLDPEPLADLPARAALTPSERQGLHGTLAGGARWAAERAASEASEALGLAIGGDAEPGLVDRVRLEVRDSGGRCAVGEATAVRWNQLVEELVLAGLDLAGEVLTRCGDRRRA